MLIPILLITCLAFATPLLKGGSPIGYDWDYFNSLSLVVRSSLVSFGKWPLQDPWVKGGMDLLANPQSRVFSPLLLVDVLLPGPWANLASLMILAGLGAWGMARLLRSQGLGHAASLVGAALWINGSWFGLHFAEGHIAFGSLQLMPWILHCLRRPRQPRRLFGYFSILAFFLLDGGMYAFGLGALLTLACLASGWCRWRDAEAPPVGTTLTAAALSAFVFLLLSSLKLLPLLSQFRTRETWLIPANIPLQALLDYFFDPFQSPLKPNPFATPLRYHEYGCYVGWLGALLVLGSTLRRGFTRRHRALLLLTALFFWVGAGWGGRFNPWSLFEKLPILKNLRVQSRVFVLMHLSLCVLTAQALAVWFRKKPRLAWIISGVLVLESIGVRNFPVAEIYRLASRPAWTQSLITESRWDRTVPWAPKPDHYFQGGQGAVDTYEPVALPTQVKAMGQPGYRGEAYAVDPGEPAEVHLDRVVPGEIRVSWSSPSNRPFTLELNQNWLGGWVVTEGQEMLEVEPSLSGLIQGTVRSARGAARLEYRPDYLPLSLALGAFGVLLWFGIGVPLFRAEALRTRRAKP